MRIPTALMEQRRGDEPGTFDVYAPKSWTCEATQWVGTFHSAKLADFFIEACRKFATIDIGERWENLNDQSR